MDNIIGEAFGNLFLWSNDVMKELQIKGGSYDLYSQSACENISRIIYEGVSTATEGWFGTFPANYGFYHSDRAGGKVSWVSAKIPNRTYDTKPDGAITFGEGIGMLFVQVVKDAAINQSGNIVVYLNIEGFEVIFDDTKNSANSGFILEGKDNTDGENAFLENVIARRQPFAGDVDFHFRDNRSMQNCTAVVYPSIINDLKLQILLDVSGNVINASELTSKVKRHVGKEFLNILENLDKYMSEMVE